MRIKKSIVAMLVGVSMFGLMGCTEVDQSTETQTGEKQEKLLEESNKQAGMPNVKNFFEKKMAKDIWELRDNPDLTTYAYTQNMDGKFTYLGRCVGYGLPYTTQYTNPQQIVDRYEGDVTIAQADPNGLYSSETTNATWLMVINEETNEREIMYSEPSIIIKQTKLPARMCTEWSLPSNY